MISEDPSAEVAGLRKQAGAAQRLARAAVKGADGLVRQVAAEVGCGGWALVVDRLGGVRSAHPEEAAEHMPALAARLEELLSRGIAGNLVTKLGGDTVHLQTVGGSDVALVLVVGSPRAPDAPLVAALNMAASLVEIEVNAARRVHGAEERLHDAVLQLLLSGEVDKASRAMPGGLPDEPVRVVRVAGPEGALKMVRHRFAKFHGHRRGTPVVAAAGEEIVVCLHVEPRSEGLLNDVVSGLGQRGVRAGASDRSSLREVESAYGEAGHALRAARATGRALMSFSELAEERLLGLIPRPELVGWAAALLRPVTEADNARLSLRRTLQTWLECHGRISQTAAALDVAPQTVRDRMARIGRLVRANLDDECVRVRLYLAMRVLADAEQPERPEHDGPVLDAGKDCVVWLLDIREGVSWAASVIKPLREADPEGRLRSTLLTWLASHGELGETAAKLGIHRNTLRQRLSRVEKILDIPLGWIGNRAQLYLALLTEDLAARDALPPEAYAHEH